MRCIAAPKSLFGPAQRAEWMPGAPPSASTTSPESSANAGKPAAFAAAVALMQAFSRKVAPLSAGSLRPSSGGDRIHPVRCEQLAHLSELARIMHRDHQPA